MFKLCELAVLFLGECQGPTPTREAGKILRQTLQGPLRGGEAFVPLLGMGLWFGQFEAPRNLQLSQTGTKRAGIPTRGLIPLLS